MKKDYTALYSVYPLLTWGGFAVVIVYALNWFEAHAIGPGLFGIIMAVSYSVAFVSQIVLGELISKHPIITLRRVIIAVSLIALICGLLLCFIDFVTRPVPIVLFSVIVCCTVIYPSLVNSLAISAPYEGYKINFGIARGIGALGFALASLVTGWLVESHGVSIIVKLYIFVSILFIVLSLIFPNVKSISSDNKSSSAGASLWQNKKFILLLIGATFIYIGQNLLSTYMLKIVERIGGDAGMQGTVIALAAFCEIPAMFLYTKMLKFGRCDTYLKLSGLFMFIRIVGCVLAPSPTVMYLVQFSQLMGYGLFCVASTEYVNIIGGKENAVRGQSLLAATSSLGSFLVYAFGGVMLSFFGLSLLNAFGVVIVGAGTLLFFFATERIDVDRGSSKK